MLKDFPRIYQMIYYVTSMSLSIVLFTLKILYMQFDNHSLTHTSITLIVLGLILFLGLLSRLLYYKIKNKYNYQEYYSQEEYNGENFSKENISEINGQPVSFLISNVTSLYFIESFTVPSILAFAGIHLILFIMMIKGENLQPNPFLFLYNLDIYKTKNNDFLFNFNEQTEHNEILRLSDKKNCRTYIVGSLEDVFSK